MLQGQGGTLGGVKTLCPAPSSAEDGMSAPALCAEGAERRVSAPAQVCPGS